MTEMEDPQYEIVELGNKKDGFARYRKLIIPAGGTILFLHFYYLFIFLFNQAKWTTSPLYIVVTAWGENVEMRKRCEAYHGAAFTGSMGNLKESAQMQGSGRNTIYFP